MHDTSPMHPSYHATELSKDSSRQILIDRVVTARQQIEKLAAVRTLEHESHVMSR